uniref:Uncharacterized protein n=1 Tax=Peronospora matthiolae TaxID=2874970 RepID=A0AAV1VLQ0_9STRA
MDAAEKSMRERVVPSRLDICVQRLCLAKYELLFSDPKNRVRPRCFSSWLDEHKLNALGKRRALNLMRRGEDILDALDILVGLRVRQERSAEVQLGTCNR